MQDPIFHVAFAVDDLTAARDFYLSTLGCKERTDTSGKSYAVINFFGAQMVLIEAPDEVEPSKADPSVEPYKHFGLIMDWEDWNDLADELRAKNVEFRIKPNIKDHPHIGTVGNMFVADPAGNYLEFKSYKDKSKVL
jgi:uncharacterized protein